MAPADVAIGLCGRCPVAGACLAWALSVGDCHGVWGGTTARERRAMLVAWRTDEQPDERAFADMATGDGLIVCSGELMPARPGVSRTVTIPLQRSPQPFEVPEGTSLIARERAHAAC